jgi:hypothetical protein
MLLPDSCELKLVSFNYDGIKAVFVVEDDLDTEDKFDVSIPTSNVHCSFPITHNFEISRFHFKVEELSNYLEVNDKNQYMPPSDYASIMKCSSMCCYWQKCKVFEESSFCDW